MESSIDTSTQQSIKKLQARLKLSGIILDISFKHELPMLKSMTFLNNPSDFILDPTIINNGQFLIYGEFYTRYIDNENNLEYHLESHIDLNKVNWEIQPYDTILYILLYKQTIFINNISDEQIIKIENKLKQIIDSTIQELVTRKILDNQELVEIVDNVFGLVTAKQSRLYYNTYHQYMNPYDHDMYVKDSRWRSIDSYTSETIGIGAFETGAYLLSEENIKNSMELLIGLLQDLKSSIGTLYNIFQKGKLITNMKALKTSAYTRSEDEILSDINDKLKELVIISKTYCKEKGYDTIADAMSV
jgi:hypothetical protein